MPAELHTVDAFTSEPFAGNSAGVVLLDEPQDAAWMQAVAAELNQATTAFLAGRELRWFTAEVELPMCGHATLATAHVLHETERVAAGEAIAFETAHGTIHAARDDDGLTWVDFPAGQVGALDDPGPTLAALGLAGAEWTGASDYEHVVVVDSADRVAALSPDFAAVRTLPVERVIVTAAGGEDGADCTSRVFVPRSGLDEDAVTGSAHAVLGPLWAQRLGRTRLLARQASKRGGELTLEVDADRVRIGGHAVTISSGTLLA